MSRILIVEDESAIADNVVYALETEGFQTHWVSLGKDGLAAVRQGAVDLVILDVGLPDGSGFELCKEIRQFSEVPVIFLTARNEEVDRIVGLEIGADDYVVKPFSPRELVARVKAILKQMGQSSHGQSDPDLALDRTKARFLLKGKPLELTRYEYLILEMLSEHPERVFSREQILHRVWNEPDASLERVVDTHIKELRAKLRILDPDCDPITTRRGFGYVF